MLPWPWGTSGGKGKSWQRVRKFLLNEYPDGLNKMLALMTADVLNGTLLEYVDTSMEDDIPDSTQVWHAALNV